MSDEQVSGDQSSVDEPKANYGRSSVQLGLSLESLGYLNYLRDVLTQPGDSWRGFYRPQSPSMNFALRYQLAFATYALAALAQNTPAYRAPYLEAMRAAIERMLHVEAWGYWRVPAPQVEEAPAGRRGGLASSGHIAVLVNPHQRASLGPPSDPIARDNLQYSGHLSAMLGLYEKLSGDSRYDSPFTLRDPESGVAYTYTHTQVAERIHRQQRENSFGGVCCEQGMAYVSCNNHALASNTLHDALHGTHYSDDNARWLQTVRARMVLKGPAVRGVFGTAYMKDFKIATPVAFNFTDAWGLAFMLPFDRPLVRKLYGKFKKRGVAHAGSDAAYVSSSTVSERMEISDVPVNTGFGLILARGLGDMALAEALGSYAAREFGAGWQDDRFYYKDAPRTLHATALYALASVIAPGGAAFTSLFTAQPDRAILAEPAVLELAPASSVGVSQAEYNRQARTLALTLRRVGDPAALRSSSPVDATVTVGNIPTQSHIEIGGRPLSGDEYTRQADRLTFGVRVNPADEVRCLIRLET
jgi:hypothetical protein